MLCSTCRKLLPDITDITHRISSLLGHVVLPCRCRPLRKAVDGHFQEHKNEISSSRPLSRQSSRETLKDATPALHHTLFYDSSEEEQLSFDMEADEERSRPANVVPMSSHHALDKLGTGEREKMAGPRSSAAWSEEHKECSISIHPATHDTSRAKYHMKELGLFAQRLEEAALRAFPNRGRHRYKQVIAVLIQWGDELSHVLPEVERLRTIFESSYCFYTQLWMIPSSSSHLKLMSMVLHFLEDYGSSDNLMVVYYGGQAIINNAGQSTWLPKQEQSSPAVNWSAIQCLFEETESDVLFLLDCPAVPGPPIGSGQGITETVAACGIEAYPLGPGRNIFTHSLISVLEDWIPRPSFTAAMLHSEILAAIKHEKMERRKWADLQNVQDRKTPVYFLNSNGALTLSIELATRRSVNGLTASSRPETSRGLESKSQNRVDSPSTFRTLAPSPLNPPPVFSKFDIYNPANLMKTLETGELQIPHVLISVALEEDKTLDVEAWYSWIRQIPGLAKWAVVEGVYKSHSTTALISIPLLIWDMLPNDLAISFVSYVQSRNLLVSEEFKRLVHAKDTTHERPQTPSKLSVSVERSIDDLMQEIQNQTPEGNKKTLSDIVSVSEIPRKPRPVEISRWSESLDSGAGEAISYSVQSPQVSEGSNHPRAHISSTPVSPMSPHTASWHAKLDYGEGGGDGVHRQNRPRAQTSSDPVSEVSPVNPQVTHWSGKLDFPVSDGYTNQPQTLRGPGSKPPSTSADFASPTSPYSSAYPSYHSQATRDSISKRWFAKLDEPLTIRPMVQGVDERPQTANGPRASRWPAKPGSPSPQFHRATQSEVLSISRPRRTDLLERPQTSKGPGSKSSARGLSSSIGDLPPKNPNHSRKDLGHASQYRYFKTPSPLASNSETIDEAVPRKRSQTFPTPFSNSRQNAAGDAISHKRSQTSPSNNHQNLDTYRIMGEALSQQRAQNSTTSSSNGQDNTDTIPIYFTDFSQDHTRLQKSTAPPSNRRTTIIDGIQRNSSPMTRDRTESTGQRTAKLDEKLADIFGVTPPPTHQPTQDPQQPPIGNAIDNGSLITDLRREALFAKEEARRAWNELGTREREERDRLLRLRDGKPVFVGRFEVRKIGERNEGFGGKAGVVLGMDGGLGGLTPREANGKRREIAMSEGRSEGRRKLNITVPPTPPPKEKEKVVVYKPTSSKPPPDLYLEMPKPLGSNPYDPKKAHMKHMTSFVSSESDQKVRKVVDQNRRVENDKTRPSARGMERNFTFLDDEDAEKGIGVGKRMGGSKLVKKRRVGTVSFVDDEKGKEKDVRRI